MTNALQILREMREQAMQGGGSERIAQQHARGKMTARERLALLLDEGTFQELGALATHNITDFGMDEQHFPGDGVVTGFGRRIFIRIISGVVNCPVTTGSRLRSIR